MEDAGPDKGQEAAGEVADEAHQDGEVGNHNRKHDRYDNDPHAEGQAPDLQLPVQAPDGWEHGLRLALEQALWNRNRNRRNRNFLTSGTGTVINYDSGTGTRYL
jgi:hypothetical protein